MRLFWYILREFLKYVVGTLVLTVFLFVLFDFIHKTTKYFAEYNPKPEHIALFYLYQIPSQIMQALPIGSLLASVVAMILLSRTNEVTAMRAAGMGPMRIGLPLAVGGFVLSLFALILSEVVVPVAAQRFHYVEAVLIEGEKADDIADGQRWIRDGQTLVNFQDFDPLTQTLTRLKLVDIKPGSFRPVRSVEADLAIFESGSNLWRLSGVKILSFRPNGALERLDRRESLDLALPLEPKKLRKDRRRPGELSIPELRDRVERGDRSGIDTLALKLEYHGKYAYPFAALVVSLIGLKFGYKSERSTETAKGVILAFFIGISYWFILSAGRAFGLQGHLPPVIAAWLPNVAVLGIIGFDAWAGRRA